MAVFLSIRCSISKEWLAHATPCHSIVSPFVFFFLYYSERGGKKIEVKFPVFRENPRNRPYSIQWDTAGGGGVHLSFSEPSRCRFSLQDGEP